MSYLCDIGLPTRKISCPWYFHLEPCHNNDISKLCSDRGVGGSVLNSMTQMLTYVFVSWVVPLAVKSS